MDFLMRLVIQGSLNNLSIQYTTVYSMLVNKEGAEYCILGIYG